MQTHRPTFFVLATAFLAALIAHPCHAQAEFAVGATISASHLDDDASYTYAPGQQPEAWTYGPTFSAQGEFGPFAVKFGVDLRVAFLSGSGYGSQAADTGFRIAFPIHKLRCKPYGEVLLGVVQVKSGPASRTYTGHIDNQLIVGVDVPLPHHLAWRALEYSYGNLFGGGGEDVRHQLSSGLLVRF